MSTPPPQTLAKLPKKLTSGFQIKPKRVNPVRAIQDREYRRKQELAAAAQARAAASSSRAAGSSSSSRPQCPNKNCKSPNVVDGICQSCGRVADDSNIVAEVSFGENAQGSAIVQGSFLAADQGTVRPVAGLGHRRVAGNGAAEARERSFREARQLMLGYAGQIRVPEHVVNTGFQFYKLAAGTNFVQGRKITNVVAVCLYAACRKEKGCRIMLLDLADIVKEEVFYLGRVFKKLLETVSIVGQGIYPVFPEDLVFRFAAKLEFGDLTQKIADTAIRLVKRMKEDWMVIGRRPAGIVGACLIMAARMFNFRRTVREVVYVAKVTMATLQVRLDEFRELPSAKMTIEDFLTQDFLPDNHDPPAIYRCREEYQAKLKERGRAARSKRAAEEPVAEDTPRRAKKARTKASGAQQQQQQQQQARPEQRTDADGFVVPPLPQATPGNQPGNEEGEEDRNIIDQAIGSVSDDLEALVAEFGDAVATAAASPLPDNDDATTSNNNNTGEENTGASSATTAVGDDDAAPNASSPSTPQKGKQRGRSSNTSKGKSVLPADFLGEEWQEDEDIMEMEIMETIDDTLRTTTTTEAISDPRSAEHQRAFEEAEKRAQHVIQLVDRNGAQSSSSSSAPRLPSSLDDPDIGEDEFADDPEVMYCVLSEEDVQIKTRIWLNNNKQYLREKQEKEFKAKLMADEPKKQTRRRTRKPRIGEGQTSPASTPGEAAARVAEQRKFSKKINYDVIRQMLDGPKASGPGSAISEFTSRQTSRAGSSVGAGDDYQGRRGSQRTVDHDEADEDDADRGFDDEDGLEDVDPFADDDGPGGDYDEY